VPVLPPNPPRDQPSLQAQTVVAVVTAAVAVGVNLAVVGIARAAGASLVVPQPGTGVPTELPLGAVVAATVTGVAIGALTLGLLRRFYAAKAERSFLILVVGFVALSLTAPLGLDTSITNKLVMASMHLTTAVITVLGLVVVPDRLRARPAVAPPI
jgi:hypothetical protein